MRNALLNWTPAWIPNWHAWKIAFEKAERVDEKIGLLRIGFHVSLDRRVYGEPEYGPGDRIIYYLQIADGHCDAEYLRLKNEPHSGNPLRTPHGNVGNCAELRILVARTAFDMLAGNFFKSEWHSKDILNRHHRPTWAYTIFEDNVLNEVLYFFRIASGCWGKKRRLINLPDDTYKGNKHNGEVAHAFLDDLIYFTWKFQYFGKYAETYDVSCRTILDKIKYRLVRRMIYSGRINMLLNDDFPIDDRAMRTLKRHILTWKMGNYMPIHNSEHGRRAAAVEEAAADGCRAAEVFLLLKNRKKEHARLSEIEEIKEEAAHIARKLATLK